MGFRKFSYLGDKPIQAGLNGMYYRSAFDNFPTPKRTPTKFSRSTIKASVKRNFRYSSWLTAVCPLSLGYHIGLAPSDTITQQSNACCIVAPLTLLHPLWSMPGHFKHHFLTGQQFCYHFLYELGTYERWLSSGAHLRALANIYLYCVNTNSPHFCR